MIFVGDDWSEVHHDVYVCGADGVRLATRRLDEGLAGIATLHALLADLAADPAEVVIGIETDRGLWVTALVAAGYTPTSRRCRRAPWLPATSSAATPTVARRR